MARAKTLNRKLFLIFLCLKFSYGKDLSLLDWPVRYQLVGRVMAYQGNDA